MKLLILGASGGCGRWLTRLASERGHDVTVLVRPAAELNGHSGVRTLRGDVLQPRDLEAALGGQDAVASCLGIRWKSLSSWSPLLSPPDLTERVARALVPAMERAGVRRLVAISAGGVGDSAARVVLPLRWVFSLRNLAVIYRDLAKMEAVLGASTLDWLAVRPVSLTNREPAGRAAPVSRYALFSSVSRADVAGWMLSALEQPGPFTRRTVLLGST